MVSLADLDKKDRTILSELDMDCRQSNAEIARKLKLGKHIVSYRIAQLEKSGVITGYYALTDMPKLGKQGYRVYIKFLPMREEERKILLGYLVQSKYTWWVGEMDGNWDVGFVVWMDDHYDFEAFWADFSEKFQRHFENARISVYLRVHNYTYAFLQESGERKDFVLGLPSEVKIDEADAKILRLVAENARSGTVEIAEKAGLTPVQVAYRLKKMEKTGVIAGFRANIALPDLTMYMVSFYLNGISKKKEMLAFAAEERWSIYVDETIGLADFEWSVICPSYSEFKKSVERFKKRFFDQLRGYDFRVYSKVLKVKYF